MSKIFYYLVFISLAIVAACSMVLPRWLSDEYKFIENAQFLFLVYATTYAFLGSRYEKSIEKKYLNKAASMFFFILSLREVSYFKGLFDNGKTIIFYNFSYIKIAHIFLAFLIIYLIYALLRAKFYKFIFTKPFLFDDFLVVLTSFILQNCAEEWHFYPSGGGQNLEEYSELIFYVFLFRIFKNYSQRDIK